MIAAANDGTPKERSPKYLASITTALITAARNTDGVGRTKKINRKRITPTNQSRFRNPLMKY